MLRAVQIHPDDLNVRVLRGRSRVKCGEYEDALEDASLVLVNFNDPENPGALLVQANALYAMGDFEHALVSYHRALKQENILMTEKKEILVSTDPSISFVRYYSCRKESNKQKKQSIMQFVRMLTFFSRTLAMS